MKKVIDVYREIIQEADKYSRWEHEARKKGDPDDEVTTYQEVSTHLYWAGGLLEQTVEVNPPKQKTTSPEVA